MVTLFLADSPYIDSGSNLFRTSTFFFPQGGCQLNMLPLKNKCYSHKNAWGHKKRFTLSCSPRAMTWSIRKDKSPQSLKNDAISLWKLGTLSSGQTLTTAKYHNKNYIRWLLGIKMTPMIKKRQKCCRSRKWLITAKCKLFPCRRKDINQSIFFK